jgi:hypothetical protein
VLFTASDFMSNGASLCCVPSSNTPQAIEQAYGFPKLRGGCSRHTPQALSSTRISATNDAWKSRRKPPVAIGSPQRAQLSPQDSLMRAK